MLILDQIHSKDGFIGMRQAAQMLLNKAISNISTLVLVKDDETPIPMAEALARAETQRNREPTLPSDARRRGRLLVPPHTQSEPIRSTSATQGDTDA